MILLQSSIFLHSARLNAGRFTASNASIERPASLAPTDASPVSNAWGGDGVERADEGEPEQEETRAESSLRDHRRARDRSTLTSLRRWILQSVPPSLTVLLPDFANRPAANRFRRGGR
jgi:hypothetical protein